MDIDWNAFDSAAQRAWVVVGQFRNSPGRVWSSIQAGERAAEKFARRMEREGSIVRLAMPLLQILETIQAANTPNPGSPSYSQPCDQPNCPSCGPGESWTDSEDISADSLSLQLERVSDDQARLAREMAIVQTDPKMIHQMWCRATDNIVNAGNVATDIPDMIRLRKKAVELCLEWAHPQVAREALERLMLLPLTPQSRAEAVRLQGRIHQAERLVPRG